MWFLFRGESIYIAIISREQQGFKGAKAPSHPMSSLSVTLMCDGVHVGSGDTGEVSEMGVCGYYFSVICSSDFLQRPFSRFTNCLCSSVPPPLLPPLFFLPNIPSNFPPCPQISSIISCQFPTHLPSAFP